MKPSKKEKDLEAVREFLGFLADLYDDDNLHLIACDDDLRDNFSKIRKIYAKVLDRAK